MPTTMVRALATGTALFVMVVGAVGCSSDDGGDQQGAATTEVTGDDPPPDGEEAPGAPDAPEPGELMTSEPSSLPPVEVQGEATAVDESGVASAVLLNGCAPSGECREIDAPLVAWPGGQLGSVDFSFSTLTGADFRGADLTGANLTGANLSGANLSGARLDGANLSAVNLRGATLVGASLQGVDLRGADLTDSILDGASFRAAVFCDTAWVDGRELDDHC
jgi:hypothetical protein